MSDRDKPKKTKGPPPAVAILGSPAALGALLKGDVENAIVAATPGGIEAQEAQGQMDESFRETLPRILHTPQPEWEKLGFVFGEPADDLFNNVKFPQGWRKKTTEHSMWTEIVDNKGRKRGMIFYKAAFYDRSAHAHLERRFCVTRDYGNEEKSGTVTILIHDECGQVDRKVTGLPKPDWSAVTAADRQVAHERQSMIDAAKQKLTTWLCENYPKCDSPTEYWDEN